MSSYPDTTSRDQDLAALIAAYDPSMDPPEPAPEPEALSSPQPRPDHRPGDCAFCDSFRAQHPEPRFDPDPVTDAETSERELATARDWLR